jgi:hypothetical protein
MSFHRLAVSFATALFTACISAALIVAAAYHLDRMSEPPYEAPRITSFLDQAPASVVARLTTAPLRPRLSPFEAADSRLGAPDQSIRARGEIAPSDVVPSDVVPSDAVRPEPPVPEQLGPPHLSAVVSLRAADGTLTPRLTCTGAASLSEPRVAASADGAIALALTFQGAVDCGTGPIYAAGGADDFDGLVLRLDPDGRISWIRPVSDLGVQAVAAVAFDPWGSVLVTGSFEGTLDLGGLPLPAETDRDILLAKLDRDGSLVWQQRFGQRGLNYGVDVDVTASGRIFLLARSDTNLDFGTGELSAQGPTAFLAAFDLTGRPLWSRAWLSTGEVSPAHVRAARANRALVTGTFTGTADFGAGPVTTAGRTDGFAIQVDPTGRPLWSAQFDDSFRPIQRSVHPWTDLRDVFQQTLHELAHTHARD